MSSLIDITFRLGRLTLAGGGLCLFLLFASPAQATLSESNSTAPDKFVITNMAQFWGLSPEMKGRQQHVRMEILMYYCDTNWNVYWGESDGLTTYLPLQGIPKPIRAGDKILLEGTVLPVNQEFLWDQTSIQILSESNHIQAISAVGRLKNTEEFRSRFVEFEAVVDSVKVDSWAAMLGLVAENNQIVANIRQDKPGQTPPGLVGKRIRIRGVYAPTIDPFGRIVELAVWSPGWDEVQIIGSLADDPRFSLPVSLARDLAVAEPGATVRVAGVVRNQQPGTAVTIWDACGQIRIFSKQQEPLQIGDYIEAVGYCDANGYDRAVQEALYRRATPPSRRDSATNSTLYLAEQVRELDRESIALHPPVDFEGEVTWVDERTNFIYLQDSSGGMRVMTNQLSLGRRFQTGMIIEVKGVATMGDYAPVITNVVVRQTGTATMPVAPLVSFEQAETGTEDGQWIQMRAYVRKVTELAGRLELELVTRGGEFKAHVLMQAAPIPPGSMVLVRGVCVAVANSRRQLTGFELWSTIPESVKIEQTAPEDLFAQPKRSIASLREFNSFNAWNRRVRTTGTVTLHVPGRYLYLQDGENSLFALSHQTELLRPGDEVEIVGFPGNEGGEFLLREAVYRRTAGGREVVPVPLPAQQTANEELDGLLVRTEGVLLELVSKGSETRLVFRVNGHIFEAKLDPADSPTDEKLLPGSRLQVIGVYRIQRDEYGKPMSFLLNLRSGSDIRVLAPPPWWTLQRLLYILAGVLPVFLLALFWSLETRRKNQLLQLAQTELKGAQAKLEERVIERTRELHEEVEARRAALVRLSEAQQRLMLASRQAGMAEVATGILHNVGNILNSVNVSTSVIGDSLRRLRIEKLVQAVELLNQQNGSLAAFLTEDNRGRLLPAYFQKLAENMVQTEKALQAEMKSLTKQIEHVKAVIAWQQGCARSSGLYESLNPVELMEDALQINLGGYERHGIEVVRRYDQIPVIMADRHKVLQILINLLSNAKQALAASAANPKQVILRVYLQGLERVRFEVTDNGVGIPAENLARIFSLGFTTKANGHGFGLHSGANSATEMGGCLMALSDGINCGATLVLELPVAAPAPATTTLATTMTIEA